MSYLRYNLPDSQSLLIGLKKARRRVKRYRAMRAVTIATIVFGLASVLSGIVLGVTGNVAPSDSIGIAVCTFLFVFLPGIAAYFFVENWEDNEGFLVNQDKYEAEYNIAVLKEAGLG